MSRKINLLLILSFVLTLSCKKDNSTTSGSSTNNNPGNTNPPSVMTPTELLTNGKWWIEDIRVSPSVDIGNGPTNSLWNLEPCLQDDYIEFDVFNNYAYSQMNTLCAPNDNSPILGSWTVNSSFTTLRVNAGSRITTYDIDRLTSSFLVITTKELIQGNTYDISYEYGH